MKNFIYFILVIFFKLYNARLKMGRLSLNGCESSILKDSKFKALNINFSHACRIFEICSATTLFNRSKCIKKFQVNMLKFCADYNNYNLLGKNYCKKIVAKNMEIVKKLNYENFVSDHRIHRSLKKNSNKFINFIWNVKSYDLDSLKELKFSKKA